MPTTGEPVTKHMREAAAVNKGGPWQGETQPSNTRAEQEMIGNWTKLKPYLNFLLMIFFLKHIQYIERILIQIWFK